MHRGLRDRTARAVSADYVLTGNISALGAKAVMVLDIKKTADGVTVASASAKAKADDLPDQLDALVDKIAAELAARLGDSEPRTDIVQVEKVGEGDDEGWKSAADKEGLVTFRSDPPGAVVKVNGASFAPSAGMTYVKRKLRLNQTYTVTMELPMHLSKTQQVRITADKLTVQFALEANYANFDLTSAPSGLPVLIDGDAAGNTPVHAQLEAGPHTIAIEHPCFAPYSLDLNIQRGADVSKNYNAKRLEAMVNVEVHGPGGDLVDATLFADDREIGSTDKAQIVPKCTRELKAVPADKRLGTWTKSVTLQARQEQSFSAQVDDIAFREKKEAQAIAEREKREAAANAETQENAAASQEMTRTLDDKWTWENYSSVAFIGARTGAAFRSTIQPRFWNRHWFIGVDMMGASKGNSFDKEGPRDIDAVFNVSGITGLQYWFRHASFFFDVRGGRTMHYAGQRTCKGTTTQNANSSSTTTTYDCIDSANAKTGQWTVGLDAGVNLYVASSQFALQGRVGAWMDGTLYGSVGFGGGLVALGGAGSHDDNKAIYADIGLLLLHTVGGLMSVAVGVPGTL